jgi:hypothetical protein
LEIVLKKYGPRERAKKKPKKSEPRDQSIENFSVSMMSFEEKLQPKPKPKPKPKQKKKSNSTLRASDPPINSNFTTLN